MSPLKMSKYTALKRFLVSSGLLLLGCFVIGYVVFQARFVIAGPQVTITDKPDIIQEDRRVFISGVAKNITSIYLNGRPIVTDEEGKFTVPVILENGYSVAEIEATDRYGRTTSVTKDFVFKPTGTTTVSVTR